MARELMRHSCYQLMPHSSKLIICDDRLQVHLSQLLLLISCCDNNYNERALQSL